MFNEYPGINRLAFVLSVNRNLEKATDLIYAKSDKAKMIILKCLAVALFLSVMTNRVSQVFRYDNIRWYCIIPDSYCAMTSLVLSLAVLFGKKDNNVYHFV